jgi:hypothetical protein
LYLLTYTKKPWLGQCVDHELLLFGSENVIGALPKTRLTANPKLTRIPQQAVAPKIISLTPYREAKGRICPF